MTYNVLIVDDNPKNLQLAAATLANYEYNFEVANSGQMALYWLEKVNFDAILLDIMMPEMDGFETCKIIKENPNLKDIPIIFLTAKDDIESTTQGFELGGVDYITKPFNELELIARLSTHIELKINRDKLKEVNIWLQKEVDKKTIDLQLANKELEEANKKLLKLDEAKNDFLKSISHEIRTPLNGIVGALNLMRDYAEDPYFQEVISLLDISVGNLEKYSYAALQIAGLQIQGSNILQFETTDLNSIASHCLNSVREEYSNNEIDYQIENAKFASIISADTNYLQNALLSLLKCATTFTKAKGYIKIFFENDNNEIKLCIEDSGIPYSSKKISHYFNSVNNQNYQFERNNAMELYLAQLIFKHHNASMEFNNLPDNSGTITVIKFEKKTIPK